MTGPRIDLTVNLGHIITFSGLICAMILGWSNMTAGLQALDLRLQAMEKTVANSSQTLIEQIRMGAELRALTMRVDRTERAIEQLQDRRP